MIKMDYSMEWGSAGVCFRTSAIFDFINDLDEDINSNILKFADDTKIFKEVRCSTARLLSAAG